MQKFFFTKRLVTICRHFILVLPSELLKSTPYSHVLMKHSFRFKLKCEFKNCKKKMSHSVSLTLQVNFVSPNQTNGQKTLRYFEINANSNDSNKTVHIQMISTNRTSYYGLVSAEKRILTLKSLR